MITFVLNWWIINEKRDFKYAAVMLASRLPKNNAYKTYFRESLETVNQQEWQEIAKNIRVSKKS